MPSPFDEPLASKAHLRWHPLRGEWVTYAAHRQDRTFQPPPEYDPLAATVDPLRPTELPAGAWDVAVFDNRFPALGGQGRSDVPALHVPTAPAGGHCEVVVYTPDRDTSLGALPLDHLELLLSVWARPHAAPRQPRRRALCLSVREPRHRGRRDAAPSARPDLCLSGGAAGAGADGGAGARASRGDTGAARSTTMIDAERRDGVRMLYEGAHAVAFVPVCARYPYECWVAPIRAGGAVRRSRRRRSAPTSRAR